MIGRRTFPQPKDFDACTRCTCERTLNSKGLCRDCVNDIQDAKSDAEFEALRDAFDAEVDNE
jgi:hypothetical protein